ncbi:unnamed protein product [Mycena citricolor]|uniref:catalase n=1 Tax=Mycena citricolor TaxID=2018698 RepID=A0AAD2HCX2_9AGAR|nr:unnamed protein product [Mycena citricolor]
MKFYTETGNWDLVGNNTPVFFLRDPLKFPDLNHVVKRDPRTNMHSANSNWDFWTSLPKRFISHTFSFINKDNRDLYEAIERGDFPRWELKVQLMTEQEADGYRINPFDLTKVWPHADFPLHDVGVLELNRNPENYFAEVEQSAFNPMNVIDGIGFSPDKMLQGRLFSYRDAQNYRLGVNHGQIPVNRPRCPFHSYHRDGMMRTDGNNGSAIGYEPNSYGEWQDSPEMKEPPLKLHGDAYNYNEREYDEDYYSQPGDLFRLMSPGQQKALFKNTAANMGDSELFIKQRHVRNCHKADPAYGRGVAEALGISLEDALQSAK